MKNAQKDYTSYAIWAIVAYLMAFTALSLIAFSSIWTAVLA